MYDELVAQATHAGFEQYEIANFARNRSADARSARTALRDSADTEIPTRACRHNVNYWRGGSFYGLGPSATSYVRGVRTKNWSNTKMYCELLERNQRPTESREELPLLARAGETAAFGLRMVAGWPFETFQAATGHDLRREWADDMRQLSEQGLGQLRRRTFPPNIMAEPK
jgi:oxygen-independent coproporphyrinogen-3 oxidase